MITSLNGAEILLAVMKAQWDVGGGRILLGYNGDGGMVMLWPWTPWITISGNLAEAQIQDLQSSFCVLSSGSGQPSLVRILHFLTW